LSLRGIRLGRSLSIDGDTVFLSEVRSLSLQELCAQVTDFVIGITALSRLTGWLLALAE
jgi:hypothetical protein